MPAVSEQQRKAMHAAAGERSTLGIPKWVGEEFVGKDAEPAGGHAAGVLHVAPDGDVLVLRRSSTEPNYAGHWALPGGKMEPNEEPGDGADRECAEEIGFAPRGAKKLIDRRATPNGMVFHTFAKPVERKFAPALNDENSGYAWASLDMLPRPLHPVLEKMLTGSLGLDAADMTPDDWRGLREGFARWAREEEAEPEHAEDAVMAFDRSPEDSAEKLRPVALAFDRASVRTYDADGRLHVAQTNISKATVNPYIGREIPNWRALGLDPNKVYRLYRSAEELGKAVPTFNNLPLLSEHKAVTADSHEPDLVIGSTGTDASFEAPYLRNSLVLWARDGIDGVESDEAKEVSSAYRYRPDMTPGTAPWGEPYDGVMRDIVGNHVAIVKEGRAGADVVVGDSNEEIAKMAAAAAKMSKPVILTRKAAATLGALVAYVKPKLAQDSKLDLSIIAPALAELTAKNFKERAPKIAESFKAMVKPHLAQDATVDDAVKILETLNEIAPLESGTQDAMETNPDTGLPMPGGAMGQGPGGEDENADLRGFLQSKGMGEDDISTACGMAGKKGAADEFPPKKDDEDDKKKKGAEDAKDDDEKDKKAMDAAIGAAVAQVRKDQAAVREAERAVRPYVGELALAHDSADAIYKAALTTLGVDIDGVPAAAYPALLKTQKRTDERRAPKIAQDAATAKDFSTRFPEAGRIRVAG